MSFVMQDILVMHMESADGLSLGPFPHEAEPWPCGSSITDGGSGTFDFGPLELG